MASSTSFGSRSRSSLIRSNSKSVRPSSRCRDWDSLETLIPRPVSRARRRERLPRSALGSASTPSALPPAPQGPGDPRSHPPPQARPDPAELHVGAAGGIRLAREFDLDLAPLGALVPPHLCAIALCLQIAADPVHGVVS